MAQPPGTTDVVPPSPMGRYCAELGWIATTSQSSPRVRGQEKIAGSGFDGFHGMDPDPAMTWMDGQSESVLTLDAAAVGAPPGRWVAWPPRFVRLEISPA